MKRILIAALAIASITSCKKEDAAPAQLAVTTANIAGAWKITAETITTAGTNIDAFNNTLYYAACKKDDVYTFTTTTVANAEGATSCIPPTTATTQPYTLNATTKVISIPGNVGLGGYDGTVTSLTANTMVVEETVTVGGMTIKSVVTFSK